jgi:hypothetical protein
VIDYDTFKQTWEAQLLKARGRPGFNLDAAWLAGRWGGGQPRCEVSGHVFTTERVENALVKYPFAPSLDQIVPGGGYTKINTRVVCVLVNFAMNEWGDAYLREIAAAMMRTDPAHLTDRAQEIWTLGMAARIDEALKAARSMEGSALTSQRKRIAGLRAALTKGRTGLTAAAAKALATRRGSSLRSSGEDPGTSRL